MEKLTEDQRTILSACSFSCGCESYFRYTCPLCRLVGTAPASQFKTLLDLGLIVFGGYSPYKLTEEGKRALKTGEIPTQLPPRKAEWP